ncbi:aconitate hydratase [Cloacibacillus evryensis]|uniref:aconitate hydratase n=1 Tax=Cloacibacillus evryensis TaxID=508460 RepID=UPI0004B26840|nr:aconitate hydratase [Cloacibacillus evryensis]MEA5034497.1 aconitate hydratase [Cloacibacillus evryensis]
MGENITRKIIGSHLLGGVMRAGEEIAIRIDQTLTHDVTGTQAYLAFETLGIERVRTEKSVSYIDHNLLYADNKNPDDHLYLQTIAKKYGIFLSKAGNGICHTVHFERFGVPGKTLLGSDSHTPTGGAIGMLAIGAGGLDVAMAMAGEPIYIKMPAVVRVELKGKLRPGVSAKDVILEMLRRYTVKGGLGRVFEYGGEGLSCLNIRDRSTIANMGAEMGATTSVFPGDEAVREFFAAQGRADQWKELLPDPDAGYDERAEIDLSELEPLVAMPDMPDKVAKVSELGRVKVGQVFIGSCTNASYTDFVKAARILDGRIAHEDVSFVVAPGSRQIFCELLRDGVIGRLVESGARVLECGCGPCVGIGQAPATHGVSLRTSNRNFRGRGGTLDASLYLASPEVAAATALTGYITAPSEVCDCSVLESIREPETFAVDDRLILTPPAEGGAVEIIRGPNIKPMPVNTPMPEEYSLRVSAVRGDNVTTDDIIPANAQFSALRSNIPAISEITFGRVDPGFAARCREYGPSIIVGGENYGQGSSREHAAIAPMYLGVKIVLAKSMARIHKNNLINHGVLPLVFKDPRDLSKFSEGDEITVAAPAEQLRRRSVTLLNKTTGEKAEARAELTDREAEILIAGGQLRMARSRRLAGPEK